MAWRSLAVLVVAIVSFAASQPTVQAHPLGSGTINRYAKLESFSDAVRLTYVLDYGWQATGMYFPYADTNHDGTYSQDELDAFARGIQTTYGYALRLSIRSQQIDLEPTAASLLSRSDPNGFPTLKITMVYDAKIPPGLSGDVLFNFEDINFEDNAVWKEIVVYGSPGAVVDIPQEFTVERSEGLDAYPPLDGLTLPAQDKAGWTWRAGTGSPLAAATLPTPAPTPQSPLLRPTLPPAPSSPGFSFDWRIVAAILSAVVLATAGRLVWIRAGRR